MLEINSSLFIQIANFLLLLLVLNILLYRPIRNMLTQRRQKMENFQGAIEQYTGQAGNSEKALEEGMIAARRDGYQEKEDLKAEAREEERGILQEAGTTVEQKIGQAKQEMEAKMAEVRQALEEQTAAFSQELAEKILGRSIS